MKKERAISLHTEFTPPHLVKAVLLVSIMLFLAQFRESSSQQVFILHGEVVEFQGGGDRTALQIPIHCISQLLVQRRLEDE